MLNLSARYNNIKTNEAQANPIGNIVQTSVPKTSSTSSEPNEFLIQYFIKFLR